MDNALAIEENIRWKGDKSLSDFGKRGLVTQHTAKPDSSAKYYVYSKRPLTTKNPNPEESRDNAFLPFWEIHCLGRMAIMPGSKHKKGDPVIILDNLEPFILLEDSEAQLFEEYQNSVCIKHGLRPYLNPNNGNSYSDGDGNGNGSSRDATPLSDEIKLMIRKLKYDEKVVINSGARHATILKIADSILLQHSDDIDITTLKDFFILINEHCCKPGPLPEGERNQIWDDAIIYVAGIKAAESRKILSVSEAIREKPGKNKIVRGTISSISTPFKMVENPCWICLECGTTNYGKNPHISSDGIQNATGAIKELARPKNCINCMETKFALDTENTEYEDARVVWLQNEDVSQNLDEQLHVMVYGDNTTNIRAGELMTIHGSITIGTSGKRLVAVMHAKFVIYEDRQTFEISDKDIESFHRFASYPNVLDRLVSMTAPNIIGEEDKKLGGLRTLVGGIEEARRGRINTLFVGDKGLAKTTLMSELTEIKPNCRFINTPSASSKSALGIVDSINDMKVLVYGPIPLSSGAAVGIDELQYWTHEDQASLLMVMEHGKFYLLKYGKDRAIIANTSIFATVNPQDIKYSPARTTISKNEISLLPPLLDRFDQIYVWLNHRTKEENQSFADSRITFTKKRRPHNYNFLAKYLIYATGLKPILTPTAESMLKEFWVNLMEDNIAGNRTLDGIFRIAEATAKLQLKTEIDAKIATQIQKSIKSMLEQQGEIIRLVEDPRDAAIRLLCEITENTQSEIQFDIMVEHIRKEHPHIKSYLGNQPLDVENNRRYRELRARFIQHIERPGSQILITSRKPLIVLWQISKIGISTTDTTDTTDTKKGTEIYTKSPEVENNDKTQQEKVCQLRQLRQLVSCTSVPSNGPQYQFLKETNAYRCLACKCIYLANTKDDGKAHPCNNLKQEATN